MNNISIALILLVMAYISGISHAGILASSTRIIYNEQAVEKSLMLVNTNEYPVLTQLWTDDGEIKSEFKQSPFIVLPSIFKLAPQEIKGIRVLYNGMQLAKDKESMFWLNIYEIPAIKKKNLNIDYLNLAMNTQMKMIFRPKSLKKPDINELQQKIKYSLIQDNGLIKLELTNPTPYFIHITDLNLKNKYSSSYLNNKIDNTIPPLSKKEYLLNNEKFKKYSKNIFSYNLIDDNGEMHDYITNIP